MTTLIPWDEISSTAEQYASMAYQRFRSRPSPIDEWRWFLFSPMTALRVGEDVWPPAEFINQLVRRHELAAMIRISSADLGGSTLAILHRFKTGPHIQVSASLPPAKRTSVMLQSFCKLIIEDKQDPVSLDANAWSLAYQLLAINANVIGEATLADSEVLPFAPMPA